MILSKHYQKSRNLSEIMKIVMGFLNIIQYPKWEGFTIMMKKVEAYGGKL